MGTATVKKSWEDTQTEKLKEALKELGSGKNKICATLEAKKILGKPSDTGDCPIARYIKKVFKNAECVAVDADEISVTLPKGEICVTPPKAVSNFIVDFDEGEYYKHLDEETCAAE
jgi:hypothetical protein